MRRAMLLLLLLGVVMVSAGCARKKATTAASSLPETPPPAGAVESPEGAMAGDPLAADLDSVNEYVRAQGLLRDVYYDYDSAVLSSLARQTLAANARFLGDHQQFEIAIEGHCDERGTIEYNLALGERRASAARDYLAQLGVDASRMKAISYGEERPVCSLAEEGCWSQNRRAHLVIIARRG